MQLSADNYLGDKEFITPLIQHFDNNHLLDFLDLHDLNPIQKDVIVKGQYFFHKSNEFISLLKRLNDNHTIALNTTVKSVKCFHEVFEIYTNHETIEAKKLIIASGSPAYPQLGASDIGYKIAEHFGHSILKPSPALVGFTVQKEQFWFKNLSGISLPIKVKTYLKTLHGNILFTHKGCSGPVMMNASLYHTKGAMEIDFMPHVKIESFMKKNGLISNTLPLPKKFVVEFIHALNIKDKPINTLTDDEIHRLSSIHNYSFAPAGVLGYNKAEVTKGGINTDEIDNTTMMSKLQPNLYFIGEVLDVTGELGGYNFQWAYASANQLIKGLK